MMFSGDELDQREKQQQKPVSTIFGGVNRLSVSTNVVRQMRKAFFGSNRPATGMRQSGLRFGTRIRGTADDADEEYEEYDSEEDAEGDDNKTGNWAKSKSGFTQAVDVRGKRFPESPIDYYEDDLYEDMAETKGLDAEFLKQNRSSLSAFATSNAAGFTTLWTSGMLFSTCE